MSNSLKMSTALPGVSDLAAAAVLHAVEGEGE